jgi:GPH family glycoside/pentoside/hexuronide:cation symporter
VAWREGLGLVGVVLASVLPALLGLPATCACSACAGRWAGWAWSRAPSARAVPVRRRATASLATLWRAPAFPPAGVFMLNGIASAMPATLVLFFVQDRLQAPPQQEPPFWRLFPVRGPVHPAVAARWWRRFGLARSWLAGMVLAVAVFVGPRSWARATLRPFLVVCALSGVALGTDLALPGALLAGVIAKRATAAAPKARTLAGGTLPPSSTWRWPPAWRCRCWAVRLHARHARPEAHCRP